MAMLLRIECETSEDLREKLLILLGIAEHPLAFQHAEEPVKKELTFATLPVTEKKLRGRPRKRVEPEVSPVDAAKADETPMTPVSVVTQPGESRTATAPIGSVTMFDEPTKQADSSPKQMPAVDVTFEQVKEALQKVAAVRPTDSTDMAGLNRATLIIGTAQKGCLKIKDLKSENYAAVLAACATV
jgi:hypothetical protein